jgi:hypothetical protein
LVRALVVFRTDGAEFGSAVVGYRSGDEGALLAESHCHLARKWPAGRAGDLPLPIASPSAHAAPQDADERSHRWSAARADVRQGS